MLKKKGVLVGMKNSSWRGQGFSSCDGCSPMHICGDSSDKFASDAGVRCTFAKGVSKRLDFAPRDVGCWVKVWIFSPLIAGSAPHASPLVAICLRSYRS